MFGAYQTDIGGPQALGVYMFPAQGSTHGDDRLRPPLREGSSILSGYLLVERPTPSAGAYANHAGEDSGEVALICKAAGERHIE
jgi:hypothetical protein